MQHLAAVRGWMLAQHVLMGASCSAAIEWRNEHVRDPTDNFLNRKNSTPRDLM